MVRVPHDRNVLVQVFEKVLRVRAAHRHRLRAARRVEVSMLAGRKTHSQSGELEHGAQGSEERDRVHLFVHDDENLDALLRFAEQETVEPKVFVLGRRAPQVQFRSEPPVEDPDRLFRILNDFGKRVEIVVTRGVPLAGRGKRPSVCDDRRISRRRRAGYGPLDVVALCLACKRLEPVLLPDLQARLIFRFFVRLVVSVIRIQGVLSARN